MADKDAKGYTTTLTGLRAYTAPTTTVTVAGTGPGFGGPYYPTPGTPIPVVPTFPPPSPAQTLQGPSDKYLPVLERIATALEKIVERFC